MTPYRLLALLLAAPAWLLADGDVPVQVTPIPDQTFTTGAAATTIDLSTRFTLPEVSGQVVRFETTRGAIFAELLPSAAPKTVENFLENYVKPGAYTNTFIHRSVSEFVIQGGGFQADSNLSPIATKPKVDNEYNLPNVRGTIAMAKLDGQVNSATSQWFINLADNTTDLGSLNNGGYTVFARVIGGGMATADAISAIPTYSLTFLRPALTDTPLIDVLPGQEQLYIDNLVIVKSVTTPIAIYPTAKSKPAESVLFFDILNTAPTVVTATLKGTALTLLPGKTPGVARISVRDSNGNFTPVSFTVTVSAPVQSAPASATTTAGEPATFTIAPAPEGSTYQWQRKPANTTTWSDISDQAPYSGATTPALHIATTAVAMHGTRFQCLVTTNGVTTARPAATLSVVPAPIPAVASQTFYARNTLLLDLPAGNPGGVTYYASGLPAGLTLDPVTGKITGTITAKPGSYTVTYWTQFGTTKSAPQTLTIVVKSFPLPMVGLYETMLADATGLPVAKLELNITGTGAFTGKLTTSELQEFPLKGALTLVNASAEPETQANEYSSITLDLPRKAAPTAPYRLSLYAFNNTRIAATLVRLDPAPATQPTPIGSIAPQFSASVPPANATGAPWLGNFTLTFGSPTHLDDTPLEAATAPAGIGYATLKIPTNGRMALTGETADGTKVTASLTTSYSATYRAFIKPYKKDGGYLAGWLGMSRRALNKSGLRWQIKLDDKTLRTFEANPDATAFADYVATFTATAATHTLSFVGANVFGGDNMILLDNVRLLYGSPLQSVSIPNFSFELPKQPAGPDAYVYNPAGASWTFTAANGLNSSGITAKDTRLTYASARPPLGNQLGFIQGNATISQTISGLTPNTTYYVAVSVAQRTGQYHIATESNKDVYWAKPAGAGGSSYATGFGPLGLDVTAEPWTPVLPLDGTLDVAISQAGLTNAETNPDQLPVKIALDPKYTATLAAPSDLANPSKWTVKVNAAAGTFSGSFAVQRTVNGKPASLTVPFRGVLQQPYNPASETALGQAFFLLPPNQTSGNGTQSGRIQLLKP